MNTDIKITAPDLPKIIEAAKRRPKAVGRALVEAVETAGFLAEGAAKRALISGPTRAFDTGTLTRSTRFYEFDPVQLKASIYPLVDYAIYVHEGTKNMRARPFMLEAARQATPEIQRTFSEAIARAVN